MKGRSYGGCRVLSIMLYDFPVLSTILPAR